MREEKHYSTELLWYAGGLVQLAIVTLVWTYVENQTMPQRVLLIALGRQLVGLPFMPLVNLFARLQRRRPENQL